MLRVRVTLDARRVRRALASLPARHAKLTARVLNRQREQSRTRMVRGLAQVLGVQQKRLRRRLILPRSARATPQRLSASALSLLEVMPGHWFAKGRRGRGGGFDLVLAGGSRLLETRQTAGAPFRARMRSGHQGVFRRALPRDRTARGTHLPIQAVQVDVSRPGYRVRARVLADLAREFPALWARRWRGELRRAFRA